MKSLVEVINENVTNNVVMTVLDKKSVKSFADKQKDIVIKGNTPDFLVYQKKDGKTFVYFATKSGMKEFLLVSLKEQGKGVVQKILALKKGQSFAINADTVWLRIS